MKTNIAQLEGTIPQSRAMLTYTIIERYYLITPNSLPTLMKAAIALSRCSGS